MSTWFIETGVYVLAMLLALGIGLALLLWGLFGDRSKGRRRCPKCWYDLRGAATLACPECGHEVKRERHLYRNRPRWPAIIVGAIIAIPSAYLLVLYAGWQREQWALQALRGVRASPAWLVATPKNHWPKQISRFLPSGVVQFGNRADALELDVFTDDDLDEIVNLWCLERLVLASGRISEVSLARISTLNSLRDLSLYGEFSSQHLAVLANSPKLESLALAVIFDARVEYIDQIKTLRSLRLFGSGIDDRDLYNVAKCVQLDALELPIEDQVTDVGLAQLASLTQLRSLVLSNATTGWSRTLLFDISQLTNLEMLFLSHWELDESLVERLTRLEQLHEVRLYDTSLDDRHVELLAKCKSIRELYLIHDSEFTDTDLAHLASMPKLSKLVVLDTSATRAGRDAFHQRRPDVQIDLRP